MNILPSTYLALHACASLCACVHACVCVFLYTGEFICIDSRDGITGLKDIYVFYVILAGIAHYSPKKLEKFTFY